jgi:hypothetical protein
LSSEEVTRRKALELFGAAAATGATGCLGGGSESPESVEDEGPDSTGNSNGRFDQYAEEYDLTESGVGVLESYCEDLSPENRRKEKGGFEAVIEDFPDKNILNNIRIEENGDKILRVMTHSNPNNEVLMNGNWEKGPDLNYSDEYSEAWLRAYEDEPDQIEDIAVAIAEGLDC